MRAPKCNSGSLRVVESRPLRSIYLGISTFKSHMNPCQSSLSNLLKSLPAVLPQCSHRRGPCVTRHRLDLWELVVAQVLQDNGELGDTTQSTERDCSKGRACSM